MEPREIIALGADLISAGVTTAYDDPGGMTAYDKMIVWAFHPDGENVFDFDSDDAQTICEHINRLALAAGYTIAKAGGNRAEKAEAEVERLRKALEVIEQFPREGYGRRDDEGYPTEIAYDEYAYRRLVDTYREFARAARLAHGGNDAA